MAKKKKAKINNPDLKKSLDASDALLNKSVDKHQAYLQNAIFKIEEDIVGLLNELQTKDGRLLSVKHNFKNAQKIHKQLMSEFDDLYGAGRKVLTEYTEIEKDINAYYKKFAALRTFGDVDKEAIRALKQASYARFEAFGAEALEKITQEMYNQIVARGSFGALVNTMSGILTGRLDKRGRPMTQYAELWANDELMNFQNQLHLMKADEAGLDSFLYYGDVIATTRDFCAARVMKVYTREQIESWKYQWSGKSGPAMTNRGGWNCRHHWTPVDLAWGIGEEGGTPVDVPKEGITDKGLNSDDFKVETVLTSTEYTAKISKDQAARSWDREKILKRTIGKEEYTRIKDGVKKIIDDADIFIAAKKRNINSIIENGFKTQFETGTSGGMLNNSVRKRAEEKMFGKNINPIYGYFSDGKSWRESSISTRQYGSFHFKLKPGVKSRATMYSEDSLGSGRSPITIGDDFGINGFIDIPYTFSDLEKSTAEIVKERITVDIKTIGKAANTGELKMASEGSYLEAQIQGKVSMADVDTIYYPDGFSWHELSEKAVKEIEKYDINFESVKELKK